VATWAGRSLSQIAHSASVTSVGYALRIEADGGEDPGPGAGQGPGEGTGPGLGLGPGEGEGEGEGEGRDEDEDGDGDGDGDEDMGKPVFIPPSTCKPRQSTPSAQQALRVNPKGTSVTLPSGRVSPKKRSTSLASNAW